MSKKREMRELAAAHDGEGFTATGLAAALGWRRTSRKARGPAHNSGAALRIARKLGLPVNSITEKVLRKIHAEENGETVERTVEREEKHWEITLKAPTPAGGAS